MATLAESGRPQQSAELTCSMDSKSMNQQQQQQQQQQPPHHLDNTNTGFEQRGHHGQQKQSRTNSVLGCWSSKLSSIPVSFAFDLSVFATRDQNGRVTLHPVLRALDQKKAHSPGDSAGVAEERDRNNCARDAPANVASQSQGQQLEYQQNEQQCANCGHCYERSDVLIERSAELSTESGANSSGSANAALRTQSFNSVTTSDNQSNEQSFAKAVPLASQKPEEHRKTTPEKRPKRQRQALVEMRLSTSSSKPKLERLKESSDSQSDYDESVSCKACERKKKQINQRRDGHHASGRRSSRPTSNSSDEQSPISLVKVVQKLEALLMTLDPHRSALLRQSDARSSAKSVSTAARSTRSSLSGTQARASAAAAGLKASAVTTSTAPPIDLMSVSQMQLEYLYDDARFGKM